MAVSINAHGNLDRASVLVEARNGKQTTKEILPALGAADASSASGSQGTQGTQGST